MCVCVCVCVCVKHFYLEYLKKFIFVHFTNDKEIFSLDKR